MSLQSITNISVDFYDKKYILVNAKQYDKKSRFLSVTCYNHGEAYPINSGEHSAYIRYQKSDNNSVFNFCEINRYGKILVELTEQMLAVDGISCADLVIVNKGSADVDSETGEIVAIDNALILSTMPIYIDVTETSIENSNIESSYEFNGLNVALEKAEAEYEEVMKTSKSWAVGGTGVRDGEDTNNAKYYAGWAQDNAIASSTSAINASDSERRAGQYASNAFTYADNAKQSRDDAASYMESARQSADSASTSASSASDSKESANSYATAAQNSMNSAADSAALASESATSAHTYYLQTESITNGLNGAFKPMGTIEYAELAVLKEDNVVAAGYLYNISDNFITDSTFKRGAGFAYEAGTNVYYTYDGYWDCLAGTTVTGVKGDNENEYRKGNVNLTAENVGAISVTDIASVDEIKNYLGI